MHHADGESIGLFLSRDCLIEGNRVSDGFSVNIYLDNTTNTTVTRNIVFNTGKRDFNRFNQPPTGIQIANERYGGFANPSSDNVITNNILIANRCAFTTVRIKMVVV
ncbi:MAG: right-handed parallel beta-helix repeat-containing protein [Pirellulaceae bacterium]